MKPPDATAPPSPNYPRDRDELRAFVFELRDLLGVLLEDEHFIPSSSIQEAQSAWIRVEQRFSDLLSQLDQLNSNDARWTQLEQHGLTGEELTFKRKLFLRNMFAWGHRINRRWARSVLRWADTILGSLAAVFPVAGAIKEFKEAIENLIEGPMSDTKGSKRKLRRGSHENQSE
jgi:hypothetical protein